MTDEIAEANLEIINVRGLHARAATKLVQLAGRFACDIRMTAPGGEEVNAKSVMGVLLLCGSIGTVLRISARGPQANEAVSAIGSLVADKFGEPE